MILQEFYSTIYPILRLTCSSSISIRDINILNVNINFNIILFTSTAISLESKSVHRSCDQFYPRLTWCVLHWDPKCS